MEGGDVPLKRWRRWVDLRRTIDAWITALSFEVGRSLTNMRKSAVVILSGVCILGIASYGWFRYISRDARKWDSAQVTVTYRGAAGCSVALRGYADKHAMPCSGVADYFRDQLKLSAGAKYLIYDMGDSDKTGVRDLRMTLGQKGYIPVGMLVAVIQEPAR